MCLMFNLNIVFVWYGKKDGLDWFILEIEEWWILILYFVFPGLLAQLVQSITSTTWGSLVRARHSPHLYSTQPFLLFLQLCYVRCLIAASIHKPTVMKRIQLSIPEPCHENWDTMSPTQQGRYCNACAKEVIDFSNMSDTEVLNYFLKKRSGAVCGNAYPDQLDRPITAMPKKKIFVSWYDLKRSLTSRSYLAELCLF